MLSNNQHSKKKKKKKLACTLLTSSLDFQKNIQLMKIMVPYNFNDFFLFESCDEKFHNDIYLIVISDQVLNLYLYTMVEAMWSKQFYEI